MFGLIDVNMGDLFLGWDIDQFLIDVRFIMFVMYEVIKVGGFDKGGFNFDVKVRRGFFEFEDLVIGYIVGMDVFVKGFKIVYKFVKDGVFDKFIEERYRSYKEGIGVKIVSGQVDFKMLEEYVLNFLKIENKFGK